MDLAGTAVSHGKSSACSSNEHTQRKRGGSRAGNRIQVHEVLLVSQPRHLFSACWRWSWLPTALEVCTHEYEFPQRELIPPVCHSNLADSLEGFEARFDEALNNLV